MYVNVVILIAFAEVLYFNSLKPIKHKFAGMKSMLLQFSENYGIVYINHVLNECNKLLLVIENYCCFHRARYYTIVMLKVNECIYER